MLGRLRHIRKSRHRLSSFNILEASANTNGISYASTALVTHSAKTHRKHLDPPANKIPLEWEVPHYAIRSDKQHPDGFCNYRLV